MTTTTTTATGTGDPPNDSEREFDFLVSKGQFTSDCPQDDPPPLHLKHFRLHLADGRLVSLNSGHIESGTPVYASGDVYLISQEDEPAAHFDNIGPLIHWWLAGFDDGKLALVGVSSDWADYYLSEPAEDYAEQMRPVHRAARLAKITVGFLEENPDATYEDLSAHIEEAEGRAQEEWERLSSEDLLTNAEFLVRQVRDLDDQITDAGETRMMEGKAMRTLLQLAGLDREEEEDEEDEEEDEEEGEKKKKGRKRGKEEEEKKRSRRRRGKKDEEEYAVGGADGDEEERGHKRKVKHRASEGLKRSKEAKSRTLATTTPLMATVFGKAFAAQIDRKPVTGNGAGNEDDSGGAPPDSVPPKPSKRRTEEWKTKTPIAKKKGRDHFDAVKLGDDFVTSGDDVAVEVDGKKGATCKIGTVMYLLEMEDDDKKLVKHAHVRLYSWARDTLLAELSNLQELFLSEECATVPVSNIRAKVIVSCADMRITQKRDPTEPFSVPNGQFFWRKSYVPSTGRFVDATPQDFHFYKNKADMSKLSVECTACGAKEASKRESPAVVGEQIDEEDGKRFFKAALIKGTTVAVGDYLMFISSAWKTIADEMTPPTPKKPAVKSKKSRKTKAKKSRGRSRCGSDDSDEDFDESEQEESSEEESSDEALDSDESDDEEKFPEKYRKAKAGTRKGCFGKDKPYKIGRVEAIYQSGSHKSAAVKLTVRHMYRPEDTHLGYDPMKVTLVNELFWTSDTTSVSADYVDAPCVVLRLDDPSPLLCFTDFPAHFFFRRGYDTESREFVDDLPGSFGDSVPAVTPADTVTRPPVVRRLRCLDIFSGCGGLSEGLHQSGVADHKWAIEIETAAAEAFRKNNPDATVYSEDCNKLLTRIMEGSGKDGHKYPQKGDVDLIVGGPPCQGYSGMNRFSHGDYSKFRNSLVVSFLSYVDFYKPRFFVLENVRNFLRFKGNMVVRLVLEALVEMGYQCAVSVLQAGCFGVPQSRSRTIVLAAATGEVLPDHPAPLTVFVHQPRVFVGAHTLGQPRRGAPYRPMTVFDALGDLPAVEYDPVNRSPVAYTQHALSHFQKIMRIGNGSEVTDHYTKTCSDLVMARITRIPRSPRADWRDLPNVSFSLNSLTWVSKLEYNYDDKKVGRGKNGAKRGVCTCAEGKKCEPQCKQDNTIIPWCLPHTSQRHSQWAGLYGRLDLKGFFSTTVTNPEPLGKQGRVLHPDQDRVITIRECARSQGFPDRFRFAGKPLERHKQIGNAVPPPLARAIGNEIRKSVVAAQPSAQFLPMQFQLHMPVRAEANGVPVSF